MWAQSKHTIANQLFKSRYYTMTMPSVNTGSCLPSVVNEVNWHYHWGVAELFVHRKVWRKIHPWAWFGRWSHFLSFSADTMMNGDNTEKGRACHNHFTACDKKGPTIMPQSKNPMQCDHSMLWKVSISFPDLSAEDCCSFTTSFLCSFNNLFTSVENKCLHFTCQYCPAAELKPKHPVKQTKQLE